MKPKPFYVFDSGLFGAVAEGNAQAVQLLLDQGAQVNSPNLPGFPPLLTAALFGRLKLAQLLLKHGADPDLRYEGRVTPLLCAVRAGDASLVRLLLKAGVDTAVQGSQGLSALELAEACGFWDIAALLRG
jgi:uncharacterized protein